MRNINNYITEKLNGEDIDNQINDFRNKYGVRTFNSESRTPTSLSNYAFGLSENLRKTKYSFLENTSSDNGKKAMFYIISKNIKGGANKITSALNSSGLGSIWSVVSENPIMLETNDGSGNIDYMTIDKFKK